ncbi:arginine/serine-rich coiled-coil protein 2 [Linepithema humile]|uniref:arginine/serine-rich coiled-coil protein 2 n=1 Tax=Linepithema humile TaxID=83485 RepID=UPI000623793A|nr:PREDICTED: uncharacterized protein LOC105675040 [Linepithema humile]
MSRGNRAFRERGSTKIGEPPERNDSEDASPARAVENEKYTKRSKTASQKRWSSSEDSSRPYSRDIKTNSREQNNTEDTETESPDVKSEKPRRTEEHTRGKTRYSNVHASEEKIASKSFEERRKKRSKRTERRRFGEQPRTADRDHARADVRSVTKRYSEEDSFTDKSQKRKKNTSQDDELPITEILKKAQENARTKYEEPVPLPELTTDTIYIQGRSGFSAVKIGGLRRALESDTMHATQDGIAGRKDRDLAEVQMYTLIKVAIAAQKFWRCTGLVYQGLLGGMALLHFVMIYVFFDISMEFTLNYSIFSEVYTNVFSFLIILCVISIFDKFDLARFDMDHLREIYMDHAKTAIAVPLYLVTFALHQTSSKTDNLLALTHYRNVNATMWTNNTTQETFSEELKIWQKVTMSKDLLAVFAWLFVALGTRDDMLLMHLESMEKYASNAESPR